MSLKTNDPIQPLTYTETVPITIISTSYLCHHHVSLNDHFLSAARHKLKRNNLSYIQRKSHHHSLLPKKSSTPLKAGLGCPRRTSNFGKKSCVML